MLHLEGLAGMEVSSNTDVIRLNIFISMCIADKARSQPSSRRCTVLALRAT